MKRVERHAVLFLLCAAAWMMPLLGAARADEFNDERLRAGQDAYAAKRYVGGHRPVSHRGLRISRQARRPERVPGAPGARPGGRRRRTGDTQATLDRFLEVERRFGGYAQANLQPEIRSAFKALLLSRVPQATILAIPSLAGMIETEEQKIAKLPPAERRKALEAAAKREPGNVVLDGGALPRFPREAATRRMPSAGRRRRSAIQADNADALALRARARAARGEYADALKDLAALAQDERAKRPELYADNFVCLVEVRNFDAASEMAPRVPESQFEPRRRRPREGEAHRRAAAPDEPKPRRRRRSPRRNPRRRRPLRRPRPRPQRRPQASHPIRRRTWPREAGPRSKRAAVS